MTDRISGIHIPGARGMAGDFRDCPIRKSDAFAAVSGGDDSLNVGGIQAKTGYNAFKELIPGIFGIISGAKDPDRQNAAIPHDRRLGGNRTNINPYGHHRLKHLHEGIDPGFNLGL